ERLKRSKWGALMYAQLRRITIQETHRTRTSLLLWLSLGLYAFGSGCEEARHVDGQPKPGATSKAEPESIINRRTQEIRNANTEVQKGEAKIVGTKITATDYISIQGNSYVAIIGKTSILSIQHALDLYNAENGRYPKNYDEFMTDIIKANNIALP